MSATNMGSLRYLQEHLSLYQRQADDERWKGDHETAMKCRNLEEFIGIGLSLFKSLKERAHAVQDAIARGELQYSPEISEVFAERQGLAPAVCNDRTRNPMVRVKELSG